LKIYLGEESVILDESEPFELDALEKYQMGRIPGGKRPGKVRLERLPPNCKSAGQLPQGTPESAYMTGRARRWRHSS